MRLVICAAVAITILSLSSSNSWAQSGLSSIAGANGSLTGSFNIGELNFDPIARYESRSNRSQQRFDELNQLRQLRQQRAEAAKQKFQQSLVQLAHNAVNNKTQNRTAYAEAQRDYRALRNGSIAPQSLGAITTPFRLQNSDINRATRMAHWPGVLQDVEFEIWVGVLDNSIQNGAISTTEEAIQFLADLEQLNKTLNNAAAGGRVNIRDFAESRRFITGLANEIRASNLLM